MFSGVSPIAYFYSDLESETWFPILPIRSIAKHRMRHGRRYSFALQWRDLEILDNFWKNEPFLKRYHMSIAEIINSKNSIRNLIS